MARVLRCRFGIVQEDNCEVGIQFWFQTTVDPNPSPSEWSFLAYASISFKRFAINFSKNEGGGEGHLDFFRSFIQFGSVILPLLVLLVALCIHYSCLCFITNAKVRNMKNTDRQFPLACLSSHPHPTVLVNQVDHLLPVHHLDVGSVKDLTPLKISYTA